jgi:hypothetical protein
MKKLRPLLSISYKTCGDLRLLQGLLTEKWRGSSNSRLIEARIIEVVLYFLKLFPPDICLPCLPHPGYKLSPFISLDLFVLTTLQVGNVYEQRSFLDAL